MYFYGLCYRLHADTFQLIGLLPFIYRNHLPEHNLFLISSWMQLSLLVSIRNIWICHIFLNWISLNELISPFFAMAAASNNNGPSHHRNFCHHYRVSFGCGNSNYDKIIVANLGALRTEKWTDTKKYAGEIRFYRKNINLDLKSSENKRPLSISFQRQLTSLRKLFQNNFDWRVYMCNAVRIWRPDLRYFTFWFL